MRKPLAIILLLLAVLALTGCEPEEPHWHYYCAESHTESNVVYWPAQRGVSYGVTPAGFGLHVGGGLHVVNETVCDRYDSTLHIPDTAASN